MGIALILILGGLGLPIPEEVPIILAAVLTRNGQMSAIPALASCLGGVLLGDFVVYLLGYFYGEKVLSLPLTRRLLTRQREAQIKGYFHRHGFKILVSGRFVPGFRTAAYLTAGLSLTLRLHAAALGLPFVGGALPMLGSQLLEQLAETDGVKTGTDPFTHRPVVLLSSLRPDVAIVHVDEADRCGNAIVNGPLWSLRESVLAADKVVITCENLVEEGALDPDRITIPGEVVTAVALAPRGAHPTAVFRTYDYDRDHLTMYAAASQAGGGGT